MPQQWFASRMSSRVPFHEPIFPDKSSIPQLSWRFSPTYFKGPNSFDPIEVGFITKTTWMNCSPHSQDSNFSPRNLDFVAPFEDPRNPAVGCLWELRVLFRMILFVAGDPFKVKCHLSRVYGWLSVFLIKLPSHQKNLHSFNCSLHLSSTNSKLCQHEIPIPYSPGTHISHSLLCTSSIGGIGWKSCRKQNCNSQINSTCCQMLS